MRHFPIFTVFTLILAIQHYQIKAENNNNEYRNCADPDSKLTKADSVIVDFFETEDLYLLNQKNNPSIHRLSDSKSVLVNLIETCKGLPGLNLNGTKRNRDQYNCICDKILENRSSFFSKNNIDLALKYQAIAEKENKNLSCFIELPSDEEDLEEYVNKYGDNDEIESVFELIIKRYYRYYKPIEIANSIDFNIGFISICNVLPQLTLDKERGESNFYECICEKFFHNRYPMFSKETFEIALQAIKIQNQIQDLMG